MLLLPVGLLLAVLLLAVLLHRPRIVLQRLSLFPRDSLAQSTAAHTARWGPCIGTKAAVHTCEGIAVVAASSHEHQRTEDDEQKNNAADEEHRGVQATRDVVAAVVGLGVVGPQAGGWVVRPCTVPLTITVGVKNELATCLNRLGSASKP